MNKGKSISFFSNEAILLLEKAISKESTHLNPSIISTSCITTSVEDQHVVGIRGKSYHSNSNATTSTEEDVLEIEDEGIKTNVTSTISPAMMDKNRSSLDDSDKITATVSMLTKKRTKQDVTRQMGNPPLTTIVLDDRVEETENSDSCSVLVLSVPSVLFFNYNTSHQDLDSMTAYTTTTSTKTVPASSLKYLMSLSNTLKDKYIFILTLQSGRFAATIFHQMKCIVHTTSTRYTTRKGQGGAQSSNDNAKGKAKSIGSQLRRAGEEQLRKDVSACLKEWYKAGYIAKCEIIFLSVSKSLQKGFWEDVDELMSSKKVHSDGSKNIFYKKSKNVVNIPLDIGRPSYEGCCAIQDVLTTLHIDAINIAKLNIQSNQNENTMDYKAKNTEEYNEKIKLDTIVEQADGKKNENSIDIIPFTVIHSAVENGDVDQLSSLLLNEEYVDCVDVRAGPDLMTPLHIAAASSHPSSAKCIRLLLLEGHTNPGILDARNRPPYFLAMTESARNAFRTARARIPDAWDWDACKIGPALTEEDLKRKKEKAAEKKRRQREKQKLRKAADEAEVQETKRMEEELAREEAAKRTRAGLQPRESSSKPGEYACDFCQKKCRRKSEMFQKLEFYYCSTDCVKRHQRELMAAAATARLAK